MRVTKVIRDYVEEAVNGIYDPIIRNCSKDYSKRKDEVEGVIAKMADEFNTAIEKVIKEHGFTIDSWNGEKRQIINYTCYFGKKEYELIADKRNELRDEKRRKIQDILVNLELGGTKAELDEMLRALKDSTEEVAG